MRWRFPHLFGSCIAALLWFLTPVVVWAAPPELDEFTATPAQVEPGGTVTLSVSAHDPDCPDVCTTGCGQYIRADLTRWSASGGTFLSEDNGTSGSPYTATAEWQAPAVEDTFTISVYLADSGSSFCGGGRQSIEPEITVEVTSNPNPPPVVDSLTALPALLLPEEISQLLCAATDPEGDPVTYDWDAVLGTVTAGVGGAATYTTPTNVVGFDTITCTATDSGGAQGSDTVQIAVVGAEGEKALSDQVVAPQRLGADSEGNIYVVDRGAINVINLFSEQLVYRLQLGDVTSVAVDWNDTLLVGGRMGASVRDRKGDILLPLNPGGSPGDVSDVAVDLVSQRYAVLYRGSGKVVVFDASGAPVVTFGSTGDAPEQLRSPQGLASAPGGDWLVADSGHGQVKRFDAAGTLLASFGSQGGGAGEFVQLDDVSVDGNGIIYASDSFQSWVQVFDPDGTLREALGGYGAGLGQLRTPTGMVEVTEVSGLGDFDRLVIASLNTSSLQVFRRDKDPLVGPPPTAEATTAPAALSFTDTAVGSISDSLIATLGNNGTAILGLLGVTASGPFEASHGCLAVEPGQSCTITVTFAPTSLGPHAGELALDTSSGLLTVPLSGRAFVPAGISLSPNRLGFNDQEIGTISEPQPLILTNNGSVDLQIVSITASAEYLASHDCPVTLAGGASCTIQVRFAPVNVVENLLGTITVISSAAGSPHAVDMEGQGIPVIPRFRVEAQQPAGIEEGDGGPVLAHFEVTLDPAPPTPASVWYEVVTGTATPGEDFEASSGRLQFAAGQTSLTLTVPVIGDEILEPDSETFSVRLWGPLAALVEDDSVEGVILDDEVCLGPVLLANAGAEVLNGTSPIPAWSEGPGASWAVRSRSPDPYEGIAYLAAAPTTFAELTQEIHVTELAEAIDAGRQLLDFSARVRTAEDDTARVLIDYRNEDRTIVLDRFDSGELSSPAAWQEVTDLRAAPPGTRWLQVRLIGHRLTGETNDAFFDAVSLRTIRAATVDVADFSTYEGDSGVTEAALSVRLACPYYQDVVVDLATGDGTATADLDYLSAGATVVLPTGETEDQVMVDIFGDRYDEGHEAFFVDVTSVEPAEAAPLTEQATGTILDDDACPLRASAWAGNGDLLPLRLALGGIVYQRPELVAFLSAPNGGPDVTLDLARELTATRLNLMIGSDPVILPTAAAADAYLAAHPPGSGPGDDDRPLGQQLSNQLAFYNRGRPCFMGPPVPDGS